LLARVQARCSAIAAMNAFATAFTLAPVAKPGRASVDAPRVIPARSSKRVASPTAAIALPCLYASEMKCTASPSFASVSTLAPPGRNTASNATDGIVRIV